MLQDQDAKELALNWQADDVFHFAQQCRRIHCFSLTSRIRQSYEYHITTYAYPAAACMNIIGLCNFPVASCTHVSMFGKLIKQVFPNIRKRRPGKRGKL